MLDIIEAQSRLRGAGLPRRPDKWKIERSSARGSLWNSTLAICILLEISNGHVDGFGSFSGVDMEPRRGV